MAFNGTWNATRAFKVRLLHGGKHEGLKANEANSICPRPHATADFSLRQDPQVMIETLLGCFSIVQSFSSSNNFQSTLTCQGGVTYYHIPVPYHSMSSLTYDDGLYSETLFLRIMNMMHSWWVREDLVCEQRLA